MNRHVKGQGRLVPLGLLDETSSLLKDGNPGRAMGWQMKRHVKGQGRLVPTGLLDETSSLLKDGNPGRAMGWQMKRHVRKQGRFVPILAIPFCWTSHPASLVCSSMVWDYLNPDGPIRKHGDPLPHWEQHEVIQFVTFRLGDALPKEKVLHWKNQRDAWRSTWPPPWTPEQEAEYHKRFTVKLEAWLDQGAGSCLLRDSAKRHVLADVFMRFQGERVNHHAWVIMPNHVHLLFQPVHPMDILVQAWKSVSAKRIGNGSIWQANYRDTLIRDGEHFANAVRYIRNNPVKAKLHEDSFSIWQSERASLVP